MISVTLQEILTKKIKINFEKLILVANKIITVSLWLRNILWSTTSCKNFSRICLEWAKSETIDWKNSLKWSVDLNLLALGDESCICGNIIAFEAKCAAFLIFNFVLNNAYASYSLRKFLYLSLKLNNLLLKC